MRRSPGTRRGAPRPVRVLVRHRHQLTLSAAQQAGEEFEHDYGQRDAPAQGLDCDRGRRRRVLRRERGRDVRRVVRGHVRGGGGRAGRRRPRRDRAGAGARSSSASARGGSRCRSRERGVPVHGIELSTAMVARLREKPGADSDRRDDRGLRDDRGRWIVLARLPRLQHDHEPDDAGGPGGVLPKRGCAPRARWVLRDRGHGAGPPAAAGRRDLPCLPRSEDSWGIDEYDVATQGLTSHHLEIVDGRFERFSVPFRYVWPAELDLMAQLAGMTLRERWAGWNREPFTNDSRQHVSVWEMPAG